MTRIKKSLAIAAMLAVPAAAVAQPYYTERITVYEHPRYEAFVVEEGGALQSGGDNLQDTLLADSVAMAIARDRALDDVSATVSANRGQVSLSGLAGYSESQHAQQIARRIAGAGNVSGELASDLG